MSNWLLRNLLHPTDLYTEAGKPDLVYADIAFGTGKTRTGPEGSYPDQRTGADEIPLKLLNDFLGKATLIIHCDHRLKWGIGAIKPPDHEIVWCYHSGGASPRSLPAKHQTLMVYTHPDSFYKPVRVPYATPKVDGRRGFNPDGKMVGSWWDIGILSTTSSERVGWPTQKPLALMERVLEMWCPPGGKVFDPCCGSGTTLAAADRLGMQSEGWDIQPDALRLTSDRLVKENEELKRGQTK